MLFKSHFPPHSHVQLSGVKCRDVSSTFYIFLPTYRIKCVKRYAQPLDMQHLVLMLSSAVTCDIFHHKAAVWLYHRPDWNAVDKVLRVAQCVRMGLLLCGSSLVSTRRHARPSLPSITPTTALKYCEHSRVVGDRHLQHNKMRWEHHSGHLPAVISMRGRRHDFNHGGRGMKRSAAQGLLCWTFWWLPPGFDQSNRSRQASRK